MKRRAAFASLVVLSILTAAGCRSSGNDGGAGASDEAGGVGGDNAPKVIGLGTPVVVDGLQITVQDVKYSRGFEFQEPAAGYVFVAYKVSTRAVDGDQLVSSSTFTTSADGSRQGRSTIVITDQWEPLLSFEDLKQGNTIGGWIVFEVPNPDEYVELTYEASVFSDQPAFILRTRCCT
ncbi:MAG: DUF4352 domain-containing protein [Gemmatimonadales bacterium]